VNLKAWWLSGVSLVAAAVAFVESAAAQTITDGDTFKQGGVTYRLQVQVRIVRIA
jgi:hypothetical protein